MTHLQLYPGFKFCKNIQPIVDNGLKQTRISQCTVYIHNQGHNYNKDKIELNNTTIVENYKSNTKIS